MAKLDTKNLIYFVSKKDKGKSKPESQLSDKKIQQILEILANQALKEKPPTLEELELILQNSSKPNNEQKSQIKTHDVEQKDGSSSIIKLLQEKGYLRDKKKWLTNKAFFEIGGKILYEVMTNLSSGDFGFHETNDAGDGSVTIDNTKKFEPGDDIKFLSVPQTILNSVQRISKYETKIQFPIALEIDDFEEFETLEDVKVAVVYCIDLSSTMKY